MHIVVRTPVAEPILDELKKITVSETGKLIVLERNDALAKGGVILTEELSCAALAEQGVGVLLLSARPRLAETRLFGRRLALYGLRRASKQDLLALRSVQCYSALEISREGLAEVTDAVMSYVRQWPAFHLVLYLDILDPAFAVESDVPAGLTARELLYVLQRLRLIASLHSVEIILPPKLSSSTAALLASVLAELL